MSDISAQELELKCIATLIQSPNNIYNVNNLLNPECFTDPVAKKIYRAIIDLQENGKPIDTASIFQYLKDRDANFNLMELMDITTKFYTADITHVSQILYEKYMRREAISTANELIHKCHDQTNDVFDIINSNKEKMIRILSPSVQNVNTLENIIQNNLKNIKDNLGKYTEVAGVPSGYEEFDKRIGGAGKGWLMIIGGRPAMGKTTFVLNWAYNAYKIFNKNVMFFSGEMSSEQISHLIMARESSVSALDIKKNKINNIQMEHIQSQLGETRSNIFLIDDTPNPPLTHILSEATKAKMQHDIDIIFVDYLQLVRASGESRHLQVGKISRELKGLARNLNIPVIALAQLSRSVESRTDKKPILSDLKESGDIEQDADIVSFLYRPEYYSNENMEKEGMTMLITRKNRHGETGTDHMIMDKNTSTFQTYIKDQDATIHPERYNMDLTKMIEFDNFITDDKPKSFRDILGLDRDNSIPF